MTRYALDPSPEEMRAMGEAAVDYVIDFIHGLSDAPARNVDGALEASGLLGTPGLPQPGAGPPAA